MHARFLHPRPFRLLGFVTASALAFVASTTVAGQGREPEDVSPEKSRLLKTYYKKLAATPPRNANAFVELAKWCSAEGLDSQSRACYERAIAIDADHAQARAALGFERYGLGWRLRGGGPPDGESPASGQTPAAASRAGASRPPEAPAASAKSAVSSEKVPEVSDRGADEGAVTERLEAKRAWALEAAKKLGVEFDSFEDNDFLVHSTVPKSSKEYRALLKYVKFLKANLARRILGLPSSTTFWPSKLQLVLLRSEPEYERFGRTVDAQANVRDAAGAYSLGGRIVLWKPLSTRIAAVMGKTALEELERPDRRIGWWLRMGVSELLVASTPQAVKDKVYEATFDYAAQVIESEGDDLKVFNLLETAEPRARDARRNRALAMTLVDYLRKKRSNGLGTLVRRLKSDQAPEPPAEDADKEELLLFLDTQYVRYQQDALQAIFRVKPDTLDGHWKEYVLTVAKKVREASETGDNQGGGKGRRSRR